MSEGISRHIDPETLGILWFSPQDLLSQNSYFVEFDYLMDGLLTSYHHQIMENRTPTDKNFFVSRSYGHPFFLGHMKVSTDKFDTNELDQLLSIAASLKDDTKESSSRNKVLILGDLPKNAESFLKKNYKDYSFTVIQ